MVAGTIGGVDRRSPAPRSRATTLSILVVDVGTSGVRAAIVRPDATVEHVHHREVLPVVAFPGLRRVRRDARWPTAALAVATAALADGGPVEAVGIANQRASTIVWDATTGEPVAPGVGWQDLRTAGMCLVLAAEGTRFAPNQSATKLAFLLDMADPDRTRDDLRFGTVDTWIAWIALQRSRARHRPVERRRHRARAQRRQRMGRARARRPPYPARRPSVDRRFDRRSSATRPPCAGAPPDRRHRG